MKKISVFFVAVATLMLASCGLGATTNNATSSSTTATSSGAGVGGAAGNVLGSVLSAVTNGQTIGNVLQSVLGLDKLTKESLIGTWTYSQPGVAFTSEKFLAQAGGEAVATGIKEKLLPYYQKVGINSNSTQFTFKEDGTYTAKLAGKPLSGTWTFDESTYQVKLQTAFVFNITCYAKKNSNGIALLFEASKLLTVLQTITALSGNSTLQTIGNLSKNYDGLRIGFDFKH